MPTKALIRALTPRTLARRLFGQRPAPQPPLADPLHSDVPALRQAESAALYHGYRMAGDFYEFLRVGPQRVLFGLFDIAGRRDDTRDILIAAQNTFRTLAPQLFSGEAFNEPARPARWYRARFFWLSPAELWRRSATGKNSDSKARKQSSSTPPLPPPAKSAKPFSAPPNTSRGKRPLTTM